MRIRVWINENFKSGYPQGKNCPQVIHSTFTPFLNRMWKKIKDRFREIEVFFILFLFGMEMNYDGGFNFFTRMSTLAFRFSSLERRSRIFSWPCKIVLWSRFPIIFPMICKEQLVYFRIRYMQICLGLAISLFFLRERMSLTVML